MILFYIFMLIMTLLVPACMLFFGYRWKKNPPAKINNTYGYRTKRSMASDCAWKFAHKHCGAIWVKCGWFTGIITLGVMAFLPAISLEIHVVAIAAIIIVVLQIFPLSAPLFFTERALKQEFKSVF